MSDKGFTLTPIVSGENQQENKPVEDSAPIEETGQSSATTETPPQEVATPEVVETPNTVPETTVETPKKEINYDGYISPAQLEEMKTTWQSENKPQELKFANEQAEFINSYLANGGVLNEKFIRNQTIDFDNYVVEGEVSTDKGIELLKMDMMDLGGLTEAEATHQLKRKYPNLYKEGFDDTDPDDVREYDNDAMSLSIDAKKVIPRLKEEQKKYQLPEVKSTEPTPEQIEQARVAKEQYMQGASAALSEFKGYDLDLGDDVKVNFPVTEDDMGYVKELLTDPNKQNSYWRDNYVKDGKIDFNKMVLDEWRKQNFDRILKEAVHQAVAKGKEKFAKDEGIQPTLTDRSLQSGGDAVPTMAQQMSKNIKRFG